LLVKKMLLEGYSILAPPMLLVEELEGGSRACTAPVVSWSYILIRLLSLIIHQHGSADLLKALAGADVAKSQLASLFSML
jgi:hypothetical protein